MCPLFASISFYHIQFSLLFYKNTDIKCKHNHGFLFFWLSSDYFPFISRLDLDITGQTITLTCKHIIANNKDTASNDSHKNTMYYSGMCNNHNMKVRHRLNKNYNYCHCSLYIKHDVHAEHDFNLHHYKNTEETVKLMTPRLCDKIETLLVLLAICENIPSKIVSTYNRPVMLCFDFFNPIN